MSDESKQLDAPQGPSRQDLENALRVELVKQQDVTYAVVGGLAAAITAALLWALVTYTTKYQIGYMAIGVGLLVGAGVRIFGAGVDKYFGIIGAALALFGCGLGNVLSQLAFAADQQSMSYWEALGYLNGDLIVALLQDSFQPMDVLFYGLAVSAAYRISTRKVEEELVVAMAAGKVSPAPYSQYRLPAVVVFAGIIVSAVVVLYQNTSGPKTYSYASGTKSMVGEMSSGGREIGPWEYYYESGTMMQKGFFNDGRRDSAWTYYDENGNVSRVGSFRKGLEEGEWTYYNEDGRVMAKGMYRYGRQIGPWTFYHSNGNVMERGSYVANLRDGEWESFFESGKVNSKGRYDYDEKVGKWTTWNENGDITEEIEFGDGDPKILLMLTSEGKPMIRDGNGKLTLYYENGNVHERGMVKDGYRDGAWKKFFDDGKPMEDGEYRNGQYVLKTSWTQSGDAMVTNGMGQMESIEGGILLQSGKIEDGLQAGEWVSRIVGDTINNSATMFYMKGKLDGEYTSYGDGEEVTMQGKYKDGKREGEWTWYQDGGAVESKVTFANGKKEGEQLFYDAYNDLLKREIYKGGKLVETRVE